MKKEMLNKKIFVLFLIALFLTPVIATFVIAQVGGDAPSSDDENTFFMRWVNSSFDKFDAKILIFILVVIIIFVIIQGSGFIKNGGISFLIALPLAFILTAYVTPEAVLGIFRSYDTLPLMFATLLPIAALFGLSYMAIQKGSLALINGQLFMWWIYAIFQSLKLLVFFAMQYKWTYVTKLLEGYFSMPDNQTEISWYLIALITTTTVAWIMIKNNRRILRVVQKSKEEAEDLAAQQRIHDVETGIDAAAAIGEHVEGKDNKNVK